ncbi:MAG: AAA family ATPase [Micromonosporaceae bacterium]|nr:AAA family ATPase [Micromonosporaceae bacterium]
MRPLRLDLAGFAVFRDETAIDFSDAEFFALVGPTGSGKSTVLDAICFALYGTVPRWDNVRSVANALAPSCPEARVRLIFESSGRRYAATRVVRRVGRAGTRVEQTHAGLERLPAGFDLAALDEGLKPGDLGEVLAGTPGEMDAAVRQAIGLPYEQFTTCVVLPQGQFAQFLHAKGAQRQQILVNLLGLHVYERVRERAGQQQRDAEQRCAAIDQLLDDMSDVDEAALRAASDRLNALRALARDVEAANPELEAVRAGVAEAETSLRRLDAEASQLGDVRPPAGAAKLAAAVEQARRAAKQAAADVTEAEEAEAGVRDELARQPDPATLRRALDAHAERDRLAAEATQLAEAIEVAESELAAAREALAEAEAAVEAAAAELAHAQAADLAAEVRAHLVAGEPCPVCRQHVTDVPHDAPPAALAEARAAVATARADRDKRDSEVRSLERSLAQARAHHDRVNGRLAELSAHLADHAAADAITATLSQIDALIGRLNEAVSAVRGARRADRDARQAEEQTHAAVRDAWRAFDAARDGLAPLGPPPAERDDLAAAWRRLAQWAAAGAAQRAERRGDLQAAAAAAEAQAAQVRQRMDALFTDAGLPAPRDDSHSRAAAVAAERADGEVRRITERREQAATLRDQREAHQRQARVAKALAGHLKANMFERWLLEEALDLLVDGASAILRQLSGGQYELVHDKGEFAVVDHHDADLRRAVRTLSGGETFQASLALALALSEQLSGMSTAAASLESIVLDEGFGALDAGALDTVAATLENLAARGDRMVGVVTHVPALAERIPVRYEVSKDARTARVEKVTA